MISKSATNDFIDYNFIERRPIPSFDLLRNDRMTRTNIANDTSTSCTNYSTSNYLYNRYSRKDDKLC